MSKALGTIGKIAGVVALTMAIPGVGGALGLSAAATAKIGALATPPTMHSTIQFKTEEVRYVEAPESNRYDSGRCGAHPGDSLRWGSTRLIGGGDVEGSGHRDPANHPSEYWHDGEKP